MIKNKEIEGKINTAFRHAVPNVLESVLSDCEEQKGTVIVMREKKKINPWVKRIAGIAAAFVLAFGGASIYNNNYAVASTVSFDVNPSIEVKVNEKERVLAVNALNEDGRIVIGDMKFSGENLDVTVNALIGSMLRNGYLSELANSVLISVDNNDQAKATALQEKLTQEINGILQTNTFNGAVLSQTISANDNLQKLADTYDITLGKAQLIKQITDKNPQYKYEQLVSLSINEINLLSKFGNNTLEKVESVGTASDKAYIGDAKAKEAALAHANVFASDIDDFEIELEYENGTMVYEIEFTSGDYDYEYEINATTGAIIKSDKEADDDDKTTSNQAPSNTNDGNQSSHTNTGNASKAYIGEAKAKEAVITHAGITAANIRDFEIELDSEDGVMVYEIEFTSGDYDYEYEIIATTGAIIKSDKEADDDDKTPSNQAPSNTNDGNQSSHTNTGNASKAYIGEAKAKEAVITHANISGSDIDDFEIELEYKNGIMVYEIEFTLGDYDYEYEINATTGFVIKSDKEADDDIKTQSNQTPSTADTSNSTSVSNTGNASTAYISETKAKEAALSYAGLSLGDISDYNIERKSDKGVIIYEIEFKTDGYEYKFYINAITGAVEKQSKEADD